MSAKGFRTLNNVLPFSAESFRDIAEIIRQTMQGKMNVVTTLTLTTSQSTTIFQDPRIGVDSYLGFQPLTANALADLPTILATSYSATGCVINHSVSANTDRIYRVVILS